MAKLAAPSGFRDFLPDEHRKRQELIGRIRASYESFGFEGMDTPAMENLQVFLGKGGGENEKLMFRVLKRGAEPERAVAAGRGELADLALRFDLTVPLARYYATHRGALPAVFKRYQIGPVWRAERAQHGRFREKGNLFVSGIRIDLFTVSCRVRRCRGSQGSNTSERFYHVITRGNQRQNLFHDDKDREFYLDRLEQYRKRYGFTIYAYVLMSNHVHLLIETGKTPLSKIMQGLQFSYTRYFNRRYRKIGHLFQGRYRAIICDREEYLLELVRYIHLNPARMKRPSAVDEHRWSSHRAYLGAASVVEVDTASMLERFSSRVGRAREVYLRFIKEGEGQGHDERYYETVDQRFLGDDRFVEEIGKKVGEDREVEPKMRRMKFSVLLTAIAEHHDAEAKALVQAGRQRQWVKTRSMLVYMAREYGGMTVKELGKRLNRDPSIISRLYSAYTGSRDSVAESRLLRTIGQ